MENDKRSKLERTVLSLKLGSAKSGLFTLTLILILVLSPAVVLSQSPVQQSLITTLAGGERLFRPIVSGLNGMVTATHPLATAAGMQILLKGGNAFDAAVATAAAVSVVEPWMSSLGGNGFATIYVAATQEVHALNFFGTSPMAAKPEFYTQEKLNEGILASPIPSNLRGYQMMLENYGTMTLAQVLQPAIELADRGYLVTPDFVATVKGSEKILRRYPTSAKVFLPGGNLPKAGSLFMQKDYARTLRQVAERGAEDFYSGDLARRIANFYREQGGLITLEDLKEYRANKLAPLSISYRGYTIYTQPPNSSAIAVLMQMNIMEGYDVKSLGHNSAPYLHRFMGAQILSLADRNKYVADSAAVPVPIKELLSKDHASKLRAKIDPEKALSEVKASDLRSTPGGSTTHLTVVDRAGNMVALTQTLGGLFGSYVMVGDTGLFFSNQMRHMHLDPTSPSAIRGGIRPRSNQSPTIVTNKDGQPIMACGSPGGDGIWQRVPQGIMNVIDFGMDIQEACSQPRFNYGGHQETGLSLKDMWLVEDRVPATVIEKLKSMGHTIKVVPTEGGRFNGIARDPITGILTGGADPRGNTYVMGW